MNIIRAVIIIFLILEIINVFALYFFPGSKYANSLGVFTAWEKSKRDPEIHRFINYLINWIAGSKVIFIVLLIAILYTANERSLIFTGIALALSIATFFWRLYPLIRIMAKEKELDPPSYSKVLGWIIFLFVIMFLIATLTTISV